MAASGWITKQFRALFLSPGIYPNKAECLNVHDINSLNCTSISQPSQMSSFTPTSLPSERLQAGRLR